MELVNFITGFLWVIGVFLMLHGETLAIKGVWYDVRLHCRETGNIKVWAKHTKETPTVWFQTQKVWYR